MKLHILILTLPTEQATLRMRVWRALKNTGAAMLRDGVYLLPEAQQSHEIFNEMSREISGEGGTAFVFDAETSDEEKIRPLFDRSQQYLILMESLQVCKNDLNEETAVSQLKIAGHGLTGLPAPGLYGVLSTRMRSFSGLRMATIARKRRWGLILMARPSATSTIV